MKKEYLLIIGVVVAVGALFFMMQGNKNPASDTQIVPVETGEPVTVESQAGAGESTVLYTDDGFVPSSLTVSVDTTVTFINEADLPMWVASNPHPVHTDYPDFDQRQEGDSYSFIFTEAGSFSYHNHMVPTDTGTVIVE